MEYVELKTIMIISLVVALMLCIQDSYASGWTSYKKITVVNAWQDDLFVQLEPPFENIASCTNTTSYFVEQVPESQYQAIYYAYHNNVKVRLFISSCIDFKNAIDGIEYENSFLSRSDALRQEYLWLLLACGCVITFALGFKTGITR